MKSRLEQLTLFELTAEERAEIVERLETDFVLFPAPANNHKKAWERRGKKIELYIDKYYKKQKCGR